MIPELIIEGLDTLTPDMLDAFMPLGRPDLREVFIPTDDPDLYSTKQGLLRQINLTEEYSSVSYFGVNNGHVAVYKTVVCGQPRQALVAALCESIERDKQPNLRRSVVETGVVAERSPK